MLDYDQDRLVETEGTEKAAHVMRRKAYLHGSGSVLVVEEAKWERSWGIHQHLVVGRCIRKDGHRQAEKVGT
jgi:hypothetical protein